MTEDQIQQVGMELAATIKQELLDMMQEFGLGPLALQDAIKSGRIRGFDDLHDIMDANELGDTERAWQQVTEPDVKYFEGIRRGPDRGGLTLDEAMVQTRCDVVNVAQEEVDRWIRAWGWTGAQADTGPCGSFLYTGEGARSRALARCAQLNRMTAGPDNGVSARTQLAVVVPGPVDESWAVMDVTEAIEEEWEWEWIN